MGVKRTLSMSVVNLKVGNHLFYPLQINLRQKMVWYLCVVQINVNFSTTIFKCPDTFLGCCMG